VTAPQVPAALRRLVRERAALRCEYCLLAEDDAFLPHEPDHIVAVKHGGATEAENLALACFACNRYKGSDLASLDPETGSLTALFNPRLDDWPTHFAIEGGVIIPRTPGARVTVALLRLNLPVHVEVRDALTSMGRWPRRR
jgi:HNH endonuclease